MTSRAPLFANLGPVAGAGLLLLAAGAAFLLLGGVWLSSDPATLSLWTVLIGLIVLIGAMAILLWIEPAPLAPWDEGEPSPARPRSSPRSTRPAVDAEAPLLRFPPVSATRSVERAVAMTADLPFRPARAALSAAPTSIPGAYLQSLSAPGGRNGDAWSEVAPPMAAALPFSAGLQPRSDASPPWLESPETTQEEPRLELELARLRARVRELENLPGGARTSVAPPRPGLSFSTGDNRVPEPPTPPSNVVVGRRSCAGCGSGVETSGPPVLCWGCGRALCASCYWRFGPGPGLHRCPDCLARAPADPVTISGGRATQAATVPAPASPTPPSAPGPTSH